MKKRNIIILSCLIFSQLSMATDLAPTGVKIISQDKNIAWLKFKDNSNGDLFRFYFDGKMKTFVISDRKDTKWRNGKSRVVPLKINKLSPHKTHNVTIGVIKDGKKILESKPFKLTIGTPIPNSNKAPTILKVIKGANRYIWIKFRDNSNGDLFRLYFNGKANQEVTKDYKDTVDKNGKSRVFPINITKLAPNTKFNVTIGVIKDDKKVAESKSFTIQTGDTVDVREKIIQFDRELYGTNDPEYRFSWARVLFDEHFGIVISRVHGGSYTHVYRIDDNNNIRPLHQFDYESVGGDFHMSIGFTAYDNDTKLRVSECIAYHCGRIRYSFYDVRDFENIILLREEFRDNG